MGVNRGRALVDEEEELLQLAIQQSLLEQGGGPEEVSLGSCKISTDNCILDADIISHAG